MPNHFSFLEKTANLNNFHLLQLAKLVPWEHTTKLIVHPEIESIKKKNCSSSIQKQITLNLIRTTYADYYKIFTDGSKIDGRTGYGIYDDEQKVSHSGRLKTQFTIMNAEIAAILKAVEYLTEKLIPKAVIFTDSQSAAKLIKNTKTDDNYLICTIFQLINKSHLNNLTIQWIPGHIQLTGNDRADHAAKLGTTMNVIEDLPITKDDLILSLKNESICLWNERYKEISNEKGTYHFKIMPSIKLKPWFYNIFLPTDLTITISRLRTGHLATKDRLYKWGLIQNENCDTCNIPENILHILYDCPKYNNQRNKFPVLTNKPDLTLVLAENKTKDVEQIARFIKEIKISM